VPNKTCGYDDVDENCSEPMGVICEGPSVASIAKAVLYVGDAAVGGQAIVDDHEIDEQVKLSAT
jgi:hypothetical protein